MVLWVFWSVKNSFLHYEGAASWKVPANFQTSWKYISVLYTTLSILYITRYFSHIFTTRRGCILKSACRSPNVFKTRPTTKNSVQDGTRNSNIRYLYNMKIKHPNKFSSSVGCGSLVKANSMLSYWDDNVWGYLFKNVDDFDIEHWTLNNEPS